MLVHKATGEQPLQPHVHAASRQASRLRKLRDGCALPEPIPQGVKEVLL